MDGYCKYVRELFFLFLILYGPMAMYISTFEFLIPRSKCIFGKTIPDSLATDTTYSEALNERIHFTTSDDLFAFELIKFCMAQ